jgi:hypothetical protein
VRKAAQQAVNATLRKTRASSAELIAAQVNFGKSYLNEKKRFAVSRFATQKTLEGSIVGRNRPTSLARFSRGAIGSKGVDIEVAPGVSRRSKRMFLIKLPAGTADLETKFNMGLAIRLRPGESVDRKRKMVKVSKGLYLLYGPSVDQVFAQVASLEEPRAADFLEAEFNRLLEI